MGSSDTCPVVLLLLIYFRFMTCLPVYTQNRRRVHQNVLNSECSSFVVTDPYWQHQWYLNSTSSVYRDMNVIKAWRKCYNGTGITIAVVDDGLFDNPELNIDRSLDDDVDTSIPKSRRHGTRVAGVIAAKANNACGIGIAFGARLADKRVLTGKIIQDEARAALFVSSLSQIDIYSSSFNARTDSISVNHVGPRLLQSLQRGTTEGRNGRGAIYVWSTGNGGYADFPHGCAYEGYVNTPYVIPVAGAQWNYTKLPTGDQCSSIMVAAFTRDPYDRERGIVTSDGDSECSTGFARNSAAVPMVSGAIALTLQANPSLRYRDVMHILTRSSVNYLPFNPPDFITNGAGFNVSKTFGFGLLDIAKMVEMAESWENVSPLITCIYSSNITCSYLSNRTVTIDTNRCKITSLEHVEIFFKIESSRAGKFKLDLMSPSGTLSNIVPGRELDRRVELNLTVISVHFWGESPFGQWKLFADDFQKDYSNLDNGTMQFLSLKMYGTGNQTLGTTEPTTTTATNGTVNTAITTPPIKPEIYFTWTGMFLSAAGISTQANTNPEFTKTTSKIPESPEATTSITSTDIKNTTPTSTRRTSIETSTDRVTTTVIHPNRTTNKLCQEKSSDKTDTSDDECPDTNIVADNGVAKTVGAIVGGILSALCLAFIIVLIRRQYTSSLKLNCFKHPSSVENNSIGTLHISQIPQRPIKSTFI